jgi:hypothetical protein
MITSFNVVRAFEATEPISGRKRRFEPGDVIAYEMGQDGPTVTIEADKSLFLLDRSTFKACCEFIYDAGAGGGF